MKRLRKGLAVTTITVFTVLIALANILDERSDFGRQARVSTEAGTKTDGIKANTCTTAKSPTTCPISYISKYTDDMAELPKLRRMFDFSLTPWKVQYDWDSNNSNPNVNWSMVVMVKSHSKNIWSRRLARLTWAGLKYHNGVRMETIFIVGKAENQEAERQLLYENKNYGDILQLDREEKYVDVVFKTLAGMQYAGSHFPCDWIYTSADDDVMPNFIEIHEKVENFIIGEGNIVFKPSYSCQENSSIRILCGYGWFGSEKPHRQPKDKWHVSTKEYPHKIYPPYCLGPWYSMRILHVRELYDLSRRYPVLWIDDVWITGMLRLKHIRNDESILCKPTKLSWGLDGKESVAVDDSQDRLIQIWLNYFKKQVLRK